MLDKTEDNSGISFYSLLFIEDGEKHVNLGSASDSILVYLLCGALLRQSLNYYGHELTIISNKPKSLMKWIDEVSIDLIVTEIPFSTVVPPTLKFRSAHRKIDLISACGRGEMGMRPGILDLDMIMLSQFPACVASNDDLLGYNIWDQVSPAYGSQRIRDDVAKVSGTPADTLNEWWGGEFLLGPKDRFRELSQEIELIYHRYLELAESLHHQGDEIILTAALHRISNNSHSQKGSIVQDGGKINAIGRWWSSRTLSRMAPTEKPRRALYTPPSSG